MLKIFTSISWRLTRLKSRSPNLSPRLLQGKSGYSSSIIRRFWEMPVRLYEIHRCMKTRFSSLSSLSKPITGLKALDTLDPRAMAIPIPSLFVNTVEVSFTLRTRLFLLPAAILSSLEIRSAWSSVVVGE